MPTWTNKDSNNKSMRWLGYVACMGYIYIYIYIRNTLKLENLMGSDQLGGLGIHGRTVLKQIIEKNCEHMN
jgi:hypothetical protein